MWCITVLLGLLTAFMLKLPVSAVYFIVKKIKKKDTDWNCGNIKQ